MAILLGLALGAFVATSVVADAGPGATIVGTVSLMVAGEAVSAGDGARVVLACSTEGTTRTEVADEHGAFRFLNVPVDNCSIEAEVQGFMAPPLWIVTAAGATVSTDLHLGIAPLRVGLEVEGTTSLSAPKVRHHSAKGHRDVTSND